MVEHIRCGSRHHSEQSTLPHVDLDIHNVLLATYLIVVQGEELIILIIAWDRDELHESEVLREGRGGVRVWQFLYIYLSRVESQDIVSFVDFFHDFFHI